MGRGTLNDFDLERKPISGTGTLADFDLDDGGQKVYVADTDTTMGYPSDYNEDQINRDLQTSIYGKDSKAFFGNVEVGLDIINNFIRGGVSFFATTPQVAGQIVSESGETMGEGFSPTDVMLMPSTASTLGAIKLAKQTLSLTRFDESITAAGRNLIKSNEKYIKDLNITADKGAGNQVAFDLGAATGSALSAIGLAYATRSPSIAGMVFGVLQKGQKYGELRESGKSAQEASDLSTLYGGVEGGLEALGLDVFMNMLRGSKTFTRIGLRSLENATQEFLQTGSEGILDKINGISKDTWNGLLNKSLYSAALGLVVGLPVSTVATIGENSGLLGDFRKAGFTDKEAEVILTTVAQNSETAVKEFIVTALNDEARQADEVAKQPEPPTAKGGEIEIPTKSEIVDIIKKHPLMMYKGKVIDAYVVGTGASGQLRPDSDFDIVLQVPPQKGMTAQEFTEYNRRKLQQYFVDNNIASDDSIHPQWQGRRVDVYFTYDAPTETSGFKPTKVLKLSDSKLSPKEGGDQKVSKVGKSIEKKAIEQKLAESFDGLAQYTAVTIKEQSAKIAEIINSDIEKARRIVRGEEALPEGLLGGTVIKAMEDLAITTGDATLLRDIAMSPLTSETSVHAQEMRMLAERNPDSPVRAINEVMKDRQKRAKRKHKNVNKAKQETIGNIKEEMYKSSPSLETWEHFINSIQC